MTAKKFTTEEIATELSEAARLKFTDGGCDCKRCEVDRQNRQNLVAIVEQFQAENAAMSETIDRVRALTKDCEPRFCEKGEGCMRPSDVRKAIDG